jgi:hypothetical protein
LSKKSNLLAQELLLECLRSSCEALEQEIEPPCIRASLGVL